MKPTEQVRLFIRSKRIIAEKVRAATSGDKWVLVFYARDVHGGVSGERVAWPGEDGVKQSCHKRHVV